VGARSARVRPARRAGAGCPMIPVPDAPAGAESPSTAPARPPPRPRVRGQAQRRCRLFRVWIHQDGCGRLALPAEGVLRSTTGSQAQAVRLLGHFRISETSPAAAGPIPRGRLPRMRQLFAGGSCAGRHDIVLGTAATSSDQLGGGVSVVGERGLMQVRVAHRCGRSAILRDTCASRPG